MGDTDVQIGSPLRVIIVGSTLKVICEMEKSANIEVNVLNEASPKTISTSSTYKIKMGL